MYLIINEFSDVWVEKEYQEEWEDAVEDGVLFVFTFKDGDFYELDETGNFVEVEKREEKEE